MADLTANAIPKASAATTIVDSALTDSSGLLSYTRPRVGTAPASITGVSCFINSEAVSLSNGDSISTATANYGGQVFTSSGSNRPTYDTTNTIGGKPTWRFNGSHWLEANSTILALDADFCAIAVVSMTTAATDQTFFGLNNNNNPGGNYQGFFAATSSSGQNRFTTTGGSQTDIYTNDAYYLNSPYVIRVARISGTMYTWVNGVLQRSTGTARTPTITGGIGFRIGAALSNVLGTNFRFASLITGGSTFTTTQQEQAEDYLFNYYGLTNNKPAIVDYALNQYVRYARTIITDDPVQFGASTAILTGGTGGEATFNKPAAFSVYGNIAAIARSYMHQLQTDSSGQNVLLLQNSSTSGFSVMQVNSSASLEKGAIGYGNASAFSAAFADKFFMESSNCDVTHITTAVVPLTATGTPTQGIYPRMTHDISAGATNFYEIVASSPRTTLRIDRNGSVQCGLAALATNATTGFLYIPGCPGTPTGTPASYQSLVPLVVDTTNNKLYFYSGGAWRDAGP